jgi:SAM-dependent methyltransferase
MNFEGMVWEPQRLRWRGLTFALDPEVDAADELVLWKTPALVAQYQAFWAREANFKADRVLEVGLWKGGSMAFWAEALRPACMVGVDLAPHSRSAAFDRYIAERRDRLSVQWGVNQGNPEQLQALVAAAFSGPLDVVIDDASHQYELTRTSFETLFPLLRPGGVYLIEDWAWYHWPEYQGPKSPFAGAIPLTRLACELLEAVGSAGTDGLVGCLGVRQGFLAIERGPAPAAGRFRLDDVISRAPGRSPQSLRRLLGELAREIKARVRAGSIRSR